MMGALAHGACCRRMSLSEFSFHRIIIQEHAKNFSRLMRISIHKIYLVCFIVSSFCSYKRFGVRILAFHCVFRALTAGLVDCSRYFDLS